MNLDDRLPSEYIIRPATAKDIWAIRKMVFSAKLEPTQLRWEQFWLIECDAKLVACGQLRNFDGAQELGSLVVLPAWRKRGLGTYLTKYLIARATKPLYLECLGKKLANYYSRFGFVPISWHDIPKSLKFKFGISQVGRILLGFPLVFMEYSDRKNKG
jgi:amino-acid N-acetyltransferase